MSFNLNNILDDNFDDLASYLSNSQPQPELPSQSQIPIQSQLPIQTQSQIPIQSHIPIQSQSTISVSVSVSKYYWLYNSRDRKSGLNYWWLYDTEHQLTLEESYKMKLPTVKLESKIIIYVDLNQMKQSTGTGNSTRDVARVMKENLYKYRIKGIAGQICDWEVAL